MPTDTSHIVFPGCPASLISCCPVLVPAFPFQWPCRPLSVTQCASVVADAEPPALHVDADQDFANVFSKFLKAEEMFAEEEPAQLKAEEGQVGQVISTLSATGFLWQLVGPSVCLWPVLGASAPQGHLWIWQTKAMGCFSTCLKAEAERGGSPGAVGACLSCFASIVTRRLQFVSCHEQGFSVLEGCWKASAAPATPKHPQTSLQGGAARA